MLLVALLPLVLLTGNAMSQSTVPENVPSPTFFISLQTNGCQFDGVFLDSGDTFSQHGNLCAWVEETRLVYSCPAPDGICWNAGEPCTASGNRAGKDQTQCSNIGIGDTQWCCNSVSGNCTQNAGQSNNCWSWFPNPNRNVNSVVASASASRLMASVTGVSNQNIIVSTLASGGWTALAQSTAATSPTIAVSAGITTTPSATPSNNSGTGSDQDSGLSGGAIAGVAIGSVLGGIAVAALGFFFWRRHHKARQAQLSSQAQQPMAQPTQVASYYKPDEANYGKYAYTSPPPQYPVNGRQQPTHVSELATDTEPVELPSGGYHR